MKPASTINHLAWSCRSRIQPSARQFGLVQSIGLLLVLLALGTLLGLFPRQFLDTYTLTDRRVYLGPLIESRPPSSSTGCGDCNSRPKAEI